MQGNMRLCAWKEARQTPAHTHTVSVGAGARVVVRDCWRLRRHRQGLRSKYSIMTHLLGLRILVTGGAGFLGSHLCAKLIAAGHEVLCVDNFYTGRRTNLAELLQHPAFEVMRHDICFPLYVEVDEIYNLACPASPVHYQVDPVQTTK